MSALARSFLVLLGLWTITGTALNLSRHPHWYIRAWDFPRPLVVALSLLSGVPYAFFFWKGAWYDDLFLGALALTVAWQVYNILPYTPLAPRHVQEARRSTAANTFRVVVSNVLIDNRDYDRWLGLIGAANPDLILALEVDEGWDRALRPLERSHPHAIREPLANAYGMSLYSRLPLRGGRIEYLVEPGIPSLQVEVELHGGEWFRLHCVHPRPPEPRQGQDSDQRDAELQRLARRIAADPTVPVVVAGDLNDVAWSHTTHLFLRESGLLDPRLGRGFYNTFPADKPLVRFPLDHVFHSPHFRLVQMRRLPNVGSDHFPMLLELSHEPEAAAEQAPPPPRAKEEEESRRLSARVDAGTAAAGE